MAKRNKLRQNSREVVGQKIRLISMGEGKRCSTCNLLMKRRMITRYKDEYYCTERCAIQANVG